MCVKLFLEDLNPNPCPLHSTSTYICEVTIIPRVCGGISDVKDITNFIIDLQIAMLLIQKKKSDINIH